MPDPSNVPDFSAYRTGDAESNRLYSYFVIGSLGLVSAAGAKSTVSDFLASMAASADVLALAKVEVDMASIPEGKNAIIKWRGKPVFVRHRTADEIEEANNVDVSKLRDPQKDSDRTKRPEWLVMLGELYQHSSRCRNSCLTPCFLAPQVSARILVACRSVRLATMEDGTALATDPTTTFPGELARALLR